MVKLYIWFNPNTNSFYHKVCRNCTTKIGYTNQFNHLLTSTLSIFDGIVYADLSDFKCYQIMAKKRNNRYKRLLNKLNDEFNRKE